jgi:hypothetical protein
LAECGACDGQIRIGAIQVIGQVDAATRKSARILSVNAKDFDTAD